MSHDHAVAVGESVYRVKPPPRYDSDWLEPFLVEIRRHLRPGVRILDVGSGRAPRLPPGDRPMDAFYAGLDISAAELAKAPPGAFDQAIITDVCTSDPAWREQFDVVFSWQVLEHVKSLPAALEAQRRYLRPGGVMIAQFSGTFSLFGLLNRVVPEHVSHKILARVQNREPGTVFPAYYDRCWAGAIAPLMSNWNAYSLTPRYAGGGYFSFSSLAQRAYFAYENWACYGGHSNLATHYLLVAKR